MVKKFYIFELTRIRVIEQSLSAKIFVLLGLLIWGAWRDASLLAKSSLALGIDGYYYVLQVTGLFTNGGLYFHSYTPLTIYFLAGINYLIGNSVLAIKIGSIVLHLSLCCGIFSLVTILTKSAWFGILGSIIAIASGLHYFLVVEFISYLGAMTSLVWCIFFSIKAVESKRLRWILASGIFLTMALFSHRAAYPACLAFACLILIVWMTPDKITASKVLILLAVSGLCLIVAALKFFLTDSSNFGVMGFNNIIKKNFSHLGEVILLILASLTILLLLPTDSKLNLSKSTRIVIISLVLWNFLIILNPFFAFENGLQTIIGRLKVIAYIQAATSVPIAIWLILHYRKELIIYAGALTIPLILMTAFSPLPYGAGTEYLASRQRLLQSLSSHRQELQNIPLIIAPHGEQFLVTYVLNVPSQQRLPEKDSYASVYWLVHNVGKSNINGIFIGLEGEPNENDTLIIEEKVLFNYLQSVDSATYRRLVSSNEHLRRLLNDSFPKDHER